ncbi:MAG: hypothetical protein KFB95_02745 [Simkaniaceae bacterium]|nr:MAG: hypothetical protein KFB95_02745 [Simkaniaceae bacterium]
MDTSISNSFDASGGENALDFTIINPKEQTVDDFELMDVPGPRHPKMVPVKATSKCMTFYAGIKAATRYTFSNIVSVSQNLAETRTLLTAGSVLLFSPNTSGVPNERRMLAVTSQEGLESLKSSIEKQCTTNETKITFVHTPTNMMIPHSTMLAIVTQADASGVPTNTTLFFDPRATNPKDAILLDSIGETTTVHQFYSEIVKDFPQPPTLLYGSTSIQGDVVSCTAYSSVFMEETCHAVKNGENLQTFMEGIANSQTITYAKAREAVATARESARNSGW